MKRIAFWCSIALLLTGCSIEPPNTAAIEFEDLFKHFAEIKQAQLVAIAHKRQIAIAPEFTELMQAAMRADWKIVSTDYEKIRKRSYWWAGSKEDPKISNELWHPVHETYWAFKLLREWDADLLKRYFAEMLGNIPDGSIFFAGTDPGRFLSTMYCTAQGKPKIFIVTQNALADGSYMDYLRDLYAPKTGFGSEQPDNRGHKTVSTDILLPSAEEANATFREYIEDVRTGRIKATDSLRVKDGRISVEGVQGIMSINAMLASWIFEKNKNQHAFYVEESYVLPWMYPYLEPCGVILRLNRMALPSPTTDQKWWQKIIARDSACWGRLLGDPAIKPKMQHCLAARQSFSKLRCAIAGIYEFHGIINAAENAYLQAKEIESNNPEITFRLANFYLRLNRIAEAVATFQKYVDQNPSFEPARKALEEYKSIQKNRPPYE